MTTPQRLTSASRLGATLLLAVLTLTASPVRAQGEPASLPEIRVVRDGAGARLTVDGKDLMVLGLNWDYVPIGQNYAYSLWSQPDEVIVEALERDLPLVRAMGANVLRIYSGIPPRWVKYIHERYGLWTVLNHTVGRYGWNLDGAWIPEARIDYSDPRLTAAIRADVAKLVEEFRGTPGLLLWLLGNENNYGLHWKSSEIEALPLEKRAEGRARHLYQFMGEVIRDVKARDPRPVAIANGDLQYLDLVAEYCKELDVFGANVYRGKDQTDLYATVKAKLGLPVLLTEFGADAWDARAHREDDVTQARFLLSQWREIYAESAGKGRTGGAIGGLVFQWTDGWWKYRQEEFLDVHDTHASWPNGGYPDFVRGRNNMNEEWWGITAKGPSDRKGLYDVYPRTAYYALAEAWRLPAYGAATDAAAIDAHFSAIEPVALAARYRADRGALQAERLSKVRVKDLRLNFWTFSTGGKDLVPAGPAADPADDRDADFDHMESFFAELEANPAPGVTGALSLNVLGNVARNPIDEIFYENRGRPVIQEITDPVTGVTRQVTIRDRERLKVYSASLAWEAPWFRADAFYRAGHGHWGYEGDLFGVYREAYYGENVDIYGADAPIGLEVAGAGPLDGVKLAFGPQLWWGANPALLAKYRRGLGPATFTLLHHEELATAPVSAFVPGSPVPTVSTRRTSLAIEAPVGPFGVTVGGLWGGWTKVDETFQIAEETAGGTVLRSDRVRASDTFGGRAKVTLQRGRLHAYVQGAYMGLVADGGPTATTTFTGWTLKDSGSGNQVNALAGVAVSLGDLQVAPNVLWQKPLEGPVPATTGSNRNTLPLGLIPGARQDPFAVRANRDTTAGELLLTWDPTPATWFWAWDNDVREDARLAAAVGFVYRHQPTTLDTAVGFTEFGVPQLIGAPPAHDLWEVRARVVSRATTALRLVAHAWGGTAEPNGASARLVHRAGMDFRTTWNALALAGHAKWNDYGPYDYHRDYNLTFPLQLMGDLGYHLESPRWFGFPQTKLGVRGTLRFLDRYSPRYLYQGDLASRTWGREYEIRTYVQLAL
jgi:hypothetical protein